MGALTKQEFIGLLPMLISEGAIEKSTTKQLIIRSAGQTHPALIREKYANT